MGDTYEAKTDGGTHAEIAREGRRLRDEGMERAVMHADRVREQWSTLAKLALSLYIGGAKKSGREFTSYDVRQWAEVIKGVVAPPDARAWGTIFASAIRAGHIRLVRYEQHKDPKRHRAPAAVYVAV